MQLKFDRRCFLVYGMLMGIGAIAVGIWLATQGFPEIKDQSEVFFSYLASKNFMRFGLLETNFQEDVATSPSLDSHPVYYVNNPNALTKLLSYSLLSLGVIDIRWHILIAVPIFLLGQWYFYQLSRRFLGEAGGLLVLFFSATGYLMSISWSLNFYRVWWWVLLCGALYHLEASNHAKSARPIGWHRILFLFWLALLASQEYRLLLFFSLIVAGFKGFGLLSWSWRRLALVCTAAVVPVVALHQYFVLRALGWENWAKSWVYTLGNRAIGFPPREAIEEFYNRLGLVLWGYSGSSFSYRSLLDFAWQKLNDTLGVTGGTIVVLGCFATVLAACQRRLAGKTAPTQGWERSLRFLGSLALGVIGMAAIAPTDFGLMYVNLFFPLIVFFAYPCLAFAILFLSQVSQFASETIRLQQYASFTSLAGGVRQQFLLRLVLARRFVDPIVRGLRLLRASSPLARSIRWSALMAGAILLVLAPVALMLRPWALHGLLFYLGYCAVGVGIAIAAIFPNVIARLLQHPVQTVRIGGTIASLGVSALAPALFLHRSNTPIILGLYSPSYIVFLTAYSVVGLGFGFLCWYPKTVLQHWSANSRVWLILGAGLASGIAALLSVAVLFNRRFLEFLGLWSSVYLFACLLCLAAIALSITTQPQTSIATLAKIQTWVRQKVVAFGSINAIAVSLVLIPYLAAQLHSIQRFPPRQLPASAILEKYKGYSFISNTVSGSVNYFTQNWAVFVEPTDLDGSLDVYALRYAFERDKLANIAYFQPDFYLCVYPPGVEHFNCHASGEFERHALLVELGNNWRIYDLRGSALQRLQKRW